MTTPGKGFEIHSELPDLSKLAEEILGSCAEFCEIVEASKLLLEN